MCKLHPPQTQNDEKEKLYITRGALKFIYFIVLHPENLCESPLSRQKTGITTTSIRITIPKKENYQKYEFVLTIEKVEHRWDNKMNVME